MWITRQVVGAEMTRRIVPVKPESWLECTACTVKYVQGHGQEKDISAATSAVLASDGQHDYVEAAYCEEHKPKEENGPQSNG